MHKIIVTKNGGPEQLILAETPDLKPESGQLRVRVQGAGVNYVDVHQRRGEFEVPKPFTPGLEGVGTIIEAGPDVLKFKVGDRIAWIDAIGSYADQALVPAARAIPVPAEFTIQQCLLLQAMTAGFLVEEYRQIRPGDSALVHAAAGGVGQLLVRWLKHLGALVIATASTGNKLGMAKESGADVVVNYRTESFVEAVKSATQGRGVDIVFDGVGKDTLAGSIASLAERGTVVFFGASSGPAPAIDPQVLMPKAARLATGALFVYAADPNELRRRSGRVIDALKEGWLRIESGQPYPLADAARAHRDLEGRHTTGKLFLVPATTA